MPLETLDLALRQHAAERPDRVALRAGDRVWTYADLHAESARVANALLAAGVAPQERVVFLDRNVPENVLLHSGKMSISGILQVLIHGRPDARDCIHADNMRSKHTLMRAVGRISRWQHDDVLPIDIVA